MDNIIEIVEQLQKSYLLFYGVTENKKAKVIISSDGFLPFLPLSLTINVLGKGAGRTGRGYSNMEKKKIVSLHPLWNIKFTKYFNCEFKLAFLRVSLPSIRDEAYVINLDEKERNGTHWVSSFINRDKACCLVILGFNIFLKKYLAKS